MSQFAGQDQWGNWSPTQPGEDPCKYPMHPDCIGLQPTANSAGRTSTGSRLEGLAKTPAFWLALVLAFFLYRAKPIYVLYFALAIGAYFIYIFGNAFK